MGDRLGGQGGGSGLGRGACLQEEKSRDSHIVRISALCFCGEEGLGAVELVLGLDVFRQVSEERLDQFVRDVESGAKELVREGLKQVLRP